ncbi:maleylpyruvate isomerase N-terminal domain-containing protein [Streptomyces sp. BF23-19]|uniref:maleylpyruvate isomerase N-terminal domain-containing protein n=1 Tax=unclassified Streptomyces TaxID=2593676 RepID=UPI0034E4C09F
MTTTKWELLDQAYATLREAVAGVPVDGWGGATPCARWNVTQVLQHAAGDQLAYAARLTGGPGPTEDPFVPSGTLAGPPGGPAGTGARRRGRGFRRGRPRRPRGGRAAAALLRTGRDGRRRGRPRRRRARLGHRRRYGPPAGPDRRAGRRPAPGRRRPRRAPARLRLRPGPPPRAGRGPRRGGAPAGLPRAGSRMGRTRGVTARPTGSRFGRTPGGPWRAVHRGAYSG